MASKYNRVNGRSSRTKQDNAKCSKCGCVYNNYKCLNDDTEECYQCHGYEFAEFAQWVANGKQPKVEVA